MRGISILCICLNCFAWLFSSIGSLTHYLKGTITPPQPPSISLIITSFILLILNILALFYLLKKTDDKVVPRREMDMKKVLIGIGWFVIIYFVLSFVIGMIVGGIAGSTASTGTSAEAGRTAATNFGHKYGLWIFLGAVLLAIIGTAKELLPLTKDEEKASNK